MTLASPSKYTVVEHGFKRYSIEKLGCFVRIVVPKNRKERAFVCHDMTEYVNDANLQFRLDGVKGKFLDTNRTMLQINLVSVAAPTQKVTFTPESAQSAQWGSW